MKFPIPFPEICKDCVPPKRRIGCHATCKEYMDARTEHIKKLEAAQVQRQKNADAEQVKNECIRKTKRSNHDRRGK